MAGFYEQCDHRQLDLAGARADRRLGANPGSILARGLVSRPGIIGRHGLRTLAGSDRLSDFDTRVVAVADLLSAVRLDAAADLIVWLSPDGTQTATPVARLLDDGSSSLILGGGEDAVRPQWSAPVVLRSTSLPDDGEVEIVALTAMTFTEFIGGVR